MEIPPLILLMRYLPRADIPRSL